MPKPAGLLIAAAGLAVVLLALVDSGPAWSVERAGSALCALLVGRVFLALLPPGSPGGHRTPELVGTLAVSYLLGSIALRVERLAIGQLDLEATDWALAAPWILPLVAIVALGPGAMIPRHGPPAAAHTKLDGAFLGLLSLTVLFGPFQLERGEGSLIYLGLMALTAWVLLHARRARWVYLAAPSLVAFALTGNFKIAVSGDPTMLALCTAAGAGCGALFLRQADTRCMTLSSIAFSAAPLFGPMGTGFGIAGALALVFAAPAPLRKKAAAVALPLAFLGIAAAFLSPVRAAVADPPPTGIAPANSASGFEILGWIVPAVAVLSWAGWRAAPEAPRPDLRMLSAFFGLSGLWVAAALVFDELQVTTAEVRVDLWAPMVLGLGLAVLPGTDAIRPTVNGRPALQAQNG